jgi:hypothetical protein
VQEELFRVTNEATATGAEDRGELSLFPNSPLTNFEASAGTQMQREGVSNRTKKNLFVTFTVGEDDCLSDGKTARRTACFQSPKDWIEVQGSSAWEPFSGNEAPI